MLIVLFFLNSVLVSDHIHMAIIKANSNINIHRSENDDIGGRENESNELLLLQ